MRFPSSPAAFALLCSAAACGSFGASDGPSGMPSGDAAAADAGDVAIEGGPREDGAASFCPRAGAYLCEDFEGPGGYRFAGWRKDDENGRNTITVDEIASAPSATHALHFVAASGAAAATDAYVEAKTGQVSKLTLEAEVNVSAGGTHRAVLAQIQRDGGSPSLRIRATGEVEERLAGADGGLTPRTLGFLPMPAQGEWARIVLSVDIAAHAATATVGGTTNTYVLDPAWVPVALEARVGLTDAAPDVSWELFVDDVLVTAE